jgi:TolA-binding protein
MRNLPQVALAALLSSLAGCRGSAPAAAPPVSEAPPPALAPAAPAAARADAAAQPVDAAGQDRAFEEGVALFSEERYAEARQSWQTAARLGPATATGKRARKHLVKVEAILKGLREIEQQ